MHYAFSLRTRHPQGIFKDQYSRRIASEYLPNSKGSCATLHILTENYKSRSKLGSTLVSYSKYGVQTSPRQLAILPESPSLFLSLARQVQEHNLKPGYNGFLHHPSEFTTY